MNLAGSPLEHTQGRIERSRLKREGTAERCVDFWPGYERCYSMHEVPVFDQSPAEAGEAEVEFATARRPCPAQPFQCPALLPGLGWGTPALPSPQTLKPKALLQPASLVLVRVRNRTSLGLYAYRQEYSYSYEYRYYVSDLPNVTKSTATTIRHSTVRYGTRRATRTPDFPCG